MADSFAIPDQVHGGFETPQFITDLASKTVLSYPVLSMCIILVLAVVVIWLLVKMSAQHFNPTQHLGFSDSDQFGLGKREGLEAGPTRGQSYFAKDVQASGGPITSSTAAQVLSSSEFDCANRKALTAQDSWAWLNNQAHGAAENFKPDTDNGLSMKLAGL